MPRDPKAAAIEQAAPEWFQARAAERGVLAPNQLSDDEHRQIAAEFVFENMSGLYSQARRLEGDLIDPTIWPEWTARFAATGGTPQDLAELAAASHPDLPQREARRKFERELARGSGTTTPP